MWFPTKLAKKVMYSSVTDDEEKEHLSSRFSDVSTEKAESEGYDMSYTLKPTRRSRLPHITANTAGIVTIVLVYGLSIYGAVLGTWAMHSHNDHGSPYTKPIAYCRSYPSSIYQNPSLTTPSPCDGQNQHPYDLEEDRSFSVPRTWESRAHLSRTTQP